MSLENFSYEFLYQILFDDNFLLETNDTFVDATPAPASNVVDTSASAPILIPSVVVDAPTIVSIPSAVDGPASALVPISSVVDVPTSAFVPIPSIVDASASAIVAISSVVDVSASTLISSVVDGPVPIPSVIDASVPFLIPNVVDAPALVSIPSVVDAPAPTPIPSFVNTSIPTFIQRDRAASTSRRPRTHTNKKRKNKSKNVNKSDIDIEFRRTYHIHTERNRRKTVTQYLNIMRSLTPPCYRQKDDQASTMLGAVHFVKDLEVQLQILEARKAIFNSLSSSGIQPCDFSQFKVYPEITDENGEKKVSWKTKDPLGDIVVTKVDASVNIRILTAQQSGQVNKLVQGLNSYHITVLVISSTDLDRLTLHTITAQVEEEYEGLTVEQIGSAGREVLKMMFRDP